MTNMLVSDYDKTFYLNDRNIVLNRKYVKKFRHNNIFVMATGRSYLDLDKQAKLYKFEYDYAILNHGATIINSKNEIIKNVFINNEIIHDLEQELKIEDSVSSFCCSCLESRVDITNKNITKINVEYKNKEQAAAIVTIIKNNFSKYVNIYSIAPNSIEIISNKTNKALAILFIMKKVNINKRNVYTVGDENNDIEMIKEFNGYKMKNGIDILKKYAIGEVNSVHELIILIDEKSIN